MALPVTIPNQFANATASIPLSQLDSNFNTLANAVNGIADGSESLSNVSITGGTVTNVAVSATTLNTSGQVVFNDAGADVDFRVEGDTDANLLFVDASTDRVGIGTSSPTAPLNIYNSTASTLAVDGDSGSNVRVSRYSSDSTSGSVQQRKTRGTFASPTAVNSGDAVGLLNFSAFGGTNYRSIGSIQGSVDTYTSDTNISGVLTFNTNAGSTTATERMRITSDGYLRMASGSGGIQFNGDTAATNALDDYEEGTWTPVLAFGGASVGITYTNQSATYTKIGNLVTATILITLTSKGSSSGAATITGLPFSSLAFGTFNIGQVFNLSFADFPFGYTAGTTITLQQSTNAGSLSNIGAGEFANNTQLIASLTYRV